jgi:hypothetical protein
MKVAILETAHFQYALTQSEILSGFEKIFITTEQFKNDMLSYKPEMCDGKFYTIQSISENEQEILEICNFEHIDWFLISPVFDSYAALNRIVKKLDCKKVLTTHNINTWFNGRFWSPNSFKDRINMRSIIRHSDYIAVEDFIFNYLKSTNHYYFQKYKFIYIPFTIFQPGRIKTYNKNNLQLRIVLTGWIDESRRRYENVLKVIGYFAELKNEHIHFSFAGKGKGDYGKWVQSELDKMNLIQPGITSYFKDNATPDDFKKEMEIADIVLSTSNKTFKGMGTLEYIGKTKPTAAIHDMMSYELPGLLPGHLEVPKNLRGSVFNYQSVDDIIQFLNELLKDSEKLADLKETASKNSLNFIATEIRKGLPL